MQAELTSKDAYGEPGLKLILSLNQAEALAAAESIEWGSENPFGKHAKDDAGNNIGLRFVRVDNSANERLKISTDEIDIYLCTETGDRAIRSLRWLSEQTGQSFDYVDLVDPSNEELSLILRLVPSQP
ncbi:MAG TPA: hypothetical protein VK146_06015 [Tabrizicola sp.]|nr:hypothetical protein [Tabrizicola sp.]